MVGPGVDRIMKKRLIIVAGLVLLLIGIAYVKALFSHQDRDQALSPEVVEVVPANLLDDYIQKEEAANRLDSLHRLYADSLQKLNSLLTEAADTQSQADIDSLHILVENLRNRVTQAEKNAKKAKQGKTQQFEKLVATFYKGEIAQLPSDLSKYEREVSIKEIKAKAQKYFGVSAKSLNRMVKKHR
jgi:hypothetical protein